MRRVILLLLLGCSGCRQTTPSVQPQTSNVPIVAIAKTTSVPIPVPTSDYVAHIHRILMQKDAKIESLQRQIKILKEDHNSEDYNASEINSTAQAPADLASKASELARNYLQTHAQTTIPDLALSPGHIKGAVEVDDVRQTDSAMYPYDVYMSAHCVYDDPNSDMGGLAQVVLSVNPSNGSIAYKSGT